MLHDINEVLFDGSKMGLYFTCKIEHQTSLNALFRTSIQAMESLWYSLYRDITMIIQDGLNEVLSPCPRAIVCDGTLLLLGASSRSGKYSQTACSMSDAAHISVWHMEWTIKATSAIVYKELQSMVVNALSMDFQLFIMMCKCMAIILISRPTMNLKNRLVKMDRFYQKLPMLISALWRCWKVLLMHTSAKLFQSLDKIMIMAVIRVNDLHKNWSVYPSLVVTFNGTVLGDPPLVVSSVYGAFQCMTSEWKGNSHMSPGPHWQCHTMSAHHWKN
ncbi:hypothetical protein L210DRAFT_3502082 [Boletus edulis BED1]|uniref:Uncharacterized protein n=1 Tax=Boletus edulis BED1 TaxID=1328754 RepID=A0AAD4BZY6_BOLED|nr:hypothetical protein L210DRAFT_3502082 [Boletus edulis BED1]